MRVGELVVGEPEDAHPPAKERSRVSHQPSRNPMKVGSAARTRVGEEQRGRGLAQVPEVAMPK
jgi:hypothetical protein